MSGLQKGYKMSMLIALLILCKLLLKISKYANMRNMMIPKRNNDQFMLAGLPITTYVLLGLKYY